MHPLAQLDHAHVWHPFTQMNDWLAREPIVIVSGRGAILRDVRGREYLDGNSSIWTNLHGHNHPKLNRAIRTQLSKIAHSSALGLANQPASLLAAELVRVANPDSCLPGRSQSARRKAGSDSIPAGLRTPLPLSKVFFSDDGSTAVEVALKLAYEFARRTGRSRRPRFLSLAEAYHGDTVGAASLGHIELFHGDRPGLHFKSDKVMSPYCYRCPFNRAKPERADAREHRRCNWECVGKVERKFAVQTQRRNPYAALVIEPLIQGAAGMIPQPAGWLRRVAEIARGHRAQLIADEVMTGFGRTGFSSTRNPQPAASLFACHHEGIQPDFLALAKGMTGGYLPMAATLTTQAVFNVFLGEHDAFKTFFHGHSYTGNQLGAASALANLELLQTAAAVRSRARLEQALREELKTLWSFPNVGDIRQVGLIAGIELVRDWRTREPFDLRERAGARVCEEMTKRGVLTRPIGGVVVLMPPYCTTPEQARQMIGALRDGIDGVFGRHRL